MRCVKCAGENTAHAKFCRACGDNLEGQRKAAREAEERLAHDRRQRHERSAQQPREQIETGRRDWKPKVAIGAILLGVVGTLCFWYYHKQESAQTYAGEGPRGAKARGKGQAVASAPSRSVVPANPRGSYHYVEGMRPPDAWLALRTTPGQGTPATIKAQLENGTLLEVLERRDDGWWRVRVSSMGQEGWVLNRMGNRVWVNCCRTADASIQPERASAAQETKSATQAKLDQQLNDLTRSGNLTLGAVQQLVANGAHKGNALLQAIFSDAADIAEFLIGKGADVNASDGVPDAWSPLLFHARSKKMLALLHDKGANLKSKNYADQTLLHVYTNPAMVEFVLEKGGSAVAQDRSGRTPLVIVADRRKREAKNLTEEKARGAQANPEILQSLEKGLRDTDAVLAILRKFTSTDVVSSRTRDGSRHSEGKEIETQRRELVGTWQYRDEDGRENRIIFVADGTARVTRFNYGTNRVQTLTENWDITEPGRLSGIFGYVVNFRVVHNQLTFVHIPTSTRNLREEVWRRLPKG